MGLPHILPHSRPLYREPTDPHPLGVPTRRCAHRLPEKGSIMKKHVALPVLALAACVIFCSTALAASLDIRSPDPTQPYYFRLESDQSRPIRILSDHVYLDCQQHWVSGDGSSGVGIEVNGVTDVTITNCHVSHWLWGILIRRSPNANVRANVLVFNSTGVAFEDQSTNIHLTENVLSDNSFYGLEIRTSPGPIRLVRNAFAFNGPGPRLQRDPRRHFIILSPGLITKPLEKYGNTFEPPLPGE